MARGRAVGGVAINMEAMASWMDRDVEWLRHVVEYNFGCGCDFNFEDIQSCEIWNSLQELGRAEQRLEEAKRKHEAATADGETLTMEDL